MTMQWEVLNTSGERLELFSDKYQAHYYFHAVIDERCGAELWERDDEEGKGRLIAAHLPGEVYDEDGAIWEALDYDEAGGCFDAGGRCYSDADSWL